MTLSWMNLIETKCMICRISLTCINILFQINVHPTDRAVVALYQMDDTLLELSMVLASNHPLGPVIVELGQHAGAAANWRNRHMQLLIFLSNQVSIYFPSKSF